MDGEDGRARERARAIASQLSVVVPAYECAGQIGTTITRLREELGRSVDPARLELIVVDDGSSDGTAGAAEAAGADLVVRQPRNRGKGAAVRAGMLVASGPVVAFTDADLAYEPRLLLELVEAIDGGADVAIGSRAVGTAPSSGGGLRALGSRVVNLATRGVLRLPYGDTQCGLKAFRLDAARAVFPRCRVDRFAMDIEVLHLCRQQGLRVVEVAVRPSETEHSTVRIGFDTVRLFADVIRIRWRSATGRYGRADGARALDGAGEVRT